MSEWNEMWNKLLFPSGQKLDDGRAAPHRGNWGLLYDSRRTVLVSAVRCMIDSIDLRKRVIVNTVLSYCIWYIYVYEPPVATLGGQKSGARRSTCMFSRIGARARPRRLIALRTSLLFCERDNKDELKLAHHHHWRPRRLFPPAQLLRREL